MNTTEIDPEQFNHLFATVGDRLTSHLGRTDLPDVNISVTTEFEFIEINSNFVVEELLKLSLNPKLDFLNFDTKLLRLSAPLIAPLLSHIFNLSLCSGNIPQDFKIARVTPIYKGKGDKSDAGNFRPISVVISVAKILEKHVKSQLISYLLTNNLLSSCQYAYLKNHSTETALHHILGTCLDNINEGYSNIITMLDLSKRFDVLNRDILIHKLSKYGVTDTSFYFGLNHIYQTVSNLCMLTSLTHHQYLSTWEFLREQYKDPFCSLFIQMTLLLLFLMNFLLFMLMTHPWDVEVRLHLTLNQL